MPRVKREQGNVKLYALAIVLTAFATAGIAFLLVTIFKHKEESVSSSLKLVELSEISTDPQPWGINWPYQYETYKKSIENSGNPYGSSSAMPQSKLDAHPWLKRLYAGYAFSIDYREARGHAYMLYDQEVTERVTKRSQGGACLHCHSSIIPTYRRLGLQSQNKSADVQALAANYDWPAVQEGFRLASTMTYFEAHDEVMKTPDGTPEDIDSTFPGGKEPKFSENQPGDPHSSIGEAHPVSCIDCHDPKSMKLRVTRPGFVNGIRALALSDDPVKHLPSIEKWRSGSRAAPYDPNALASRQEMRSFVCAQCHVEYYCANKETLFFPWAKGLKVEQIEAMYAEHKFPDGSEFYDYKHGETGAHVYKAQHPEFELYSQGIHARSGVSCSDCHMPYERKGAMKVSSHWVQSPLNSVNNSCQTCHNIPEAELKDRVTNIQSKTIEQIELAAGAMTEMLDAIRQAQAAGLSEADQNRLFDLQRKAMWRLDFISSENSKGFHADQESVRILSESINYSRQAQALALKLQIKEVPKLDDSTLVPVQGVTPEKAKP